ncbi:MAG: 30S ribosomal protein S17 [Candidatus Nealsonbacteria bacterium CG_4_10_14_0_8_um_filter_37_14]|uniref:Small ribosomal subunit protein uS17 n=1 Tax=Candidatus Nealsonbacteria bacterium CG_4_10_14_0_8_um_filter_37_14 TaxID=1974684 RepID=A0A2M7R645_9BACT|nr:MAG: 30S ribosomal protein S17 [Candidatus Nealsonbacteria bacterium CG_4_8_14_3_um_filter_37_23]PIY88974.1 MAG: 30S ribosomal protein S17 [Candidatus Nealsonbacteria bacterium CG_4_10_14_0_8_um_filter_37_14]
MKKQLIGTVVSNKMQKTVVVEVERLKEHPKYKRRFRVHKKYKAHDEKGEYHVGDKVMIEECRPISKDKKWRVIRKITTHIGEGSGEPSGSPV